MKWWLVLALVVVGTLGWAYAGARTTRERNVEDARRQGMEMALKRPYMANRPVDPEPEHPVIYRPLNADIWNPDVGY